MESIVIYNPECEMLLQKTGADFYSDNEAALAWKELISKNRYDISIKRKKVHR